MVRAKSRQGRLQGHAGYVRDEPGSAHDAAAHSRQWVSWGHPPARSRTCRALPDVVVVRVHAQVGEVGGVQFAGFADGLRYGIKARSDRRATSTGTGRDNA